jgi:Na+(H+)/acetate symporter ActP
MVEHFVHDSVELRNVSRATIADVPGQRYSEATVRRIDPNHK